MHNLFLNVLFLPPQKDFLSVININLSPGNTDLMDLRLRIALL